MIINLIILFHNLNKSYKIYLTINVQLYRYPVQKNRLLKLTWNKKLAVLYLCVGGKIFKGKCRNDLL